MTSMTSVRTLAAAACALTLLVAAPAAAEQTIFVVRHAERADTPAPGSAAMTAPATDPPLSAAGNERAARLAAMLRSADIRHVFTTEYLRTRQTALPIAQAQRLEVVAVSSKDPEAVIAQARQATGNVLIVGHSNTIPDLLKRLGVKDTVTIGDAEYDNLFVVVRPESGEPTLVRLRY
jgi:broad specificity phosphatase PhoE